MNLGRLVMHYATGGYGRSSKLTVMFGNQICPKQVPYTEEVGR
jgi:hypothetical protein